MTKKITKLMLNGQGYEIREYQQPGWQPGPNTVLYFPFKTDQLDHVWSASIDTTWTQDTLWYNFSSSWEMKVVDAPSTTTFMSAWVKYNSYENNTSQFWWTYKGFMLYNFRHSEDVSYDRVFQASSWMYSYIKSSQQSTTTWQWYHIAMWYDWTYSYWYLNWQQVWKGTWWWYTWWWYVRFGHWIDMNVSEYIWESVCWTEQEVLDYYNATKDNYQSSEPQVETCHICWGTGEEECNICGWTWQEMCPTCSWMWQIWDPEDPESRTECPDCNGWGFISCWNCGWTWMVTCSNCGWTWEEPWE